MSTAAGHATVRTPDDADRIKKLETLRNPFAAEQIGKLPKVFAEKGAPKKYCDVCETSHAQPSIHVDFVGHAVVTARILDVDPFWNWEPLQWDVDGFPKFDQRGGLWIRMTILGVTRLGYGDGGAMTGPDAVKAAISDAIKNAAMRYGVGLELWSKQDLPDASPEYADPSILAVQIEAASTREEMKAVATEIVEATLLRAERETLKAAWLEKDRRLALLAATSGEARDA